MRVSDFNQPDATQKFAVQNLDNNFDSNIALKSRRNFLKLSSGLGLGLLLGFHFAGKANAASGTHAEFRPNAFIHIDQNGLVTIVAHKVEMGQGT